MYLVFLPLDATQSAVMSQDIIVCLSPMRFRISFLALS